MAFDECPHWSELPVRRHELGRSAHAHPRMNGRPCVHRDRCQTPDPTAGRSEQQKRQFTNLAAITAYGFGFSIRP
jgi:hypothetical protein